MQGRRIRPSVEGMEARHLPSGVIATLASHAHIAQTGGSGGSGNAGGNQGGGGTPNQFLDPTGNPTRHEMRRQAVRFVFEGKFLQGQGRFDDVASQVLIKGVGSSTYFLHGDIQLGAYVPTDPTRQTSGEAASFDRNVNANSAFVFDLLGSAADLDRAGRPTRFTFTVNPSASGGIFSNANGTGTVEVRYLPSGRHRDGVMSEGRAIVLIRGNVYTLRVNNIFGVLGTNNTLRPGKIRL